MIEFILMKSPITFLKEVRREISNVSWPSKKETFRLTGIIVSVSLIVSIFIGVLDFIFTNLMTLALK